jgi:hypothetical protein
MQGKHINTLLWEEQLPGKYTLFWEGQDMNGAQVSSGTYMCTLRINDKNAGNTVIVLSR